MKRITEHTDHGIELSKDLNISVAPEDFKKLQIILKKLADYEDTNRSPEIVQETIGCYKAICREHGVNVS